VHHQEPEGKKVQPEDENPSEGKGEAGDTEQNQPPENRGIGENL
jgi:hypothetical protein